MESNTRIWVDADACPVRDIIIRVARDFGAPVIFVASWSHSVDQDGVETIVVDGDPQSVDLAIANRAGVGDIVVTGDYGLASMALGRGARAISFRGMVYTGGNIDALMAKRHLGAKVRRGGGRVKGPKSLEPEDRERFEMNLRRILKGDRKGTAKT
ncbi:MAG: YaiI/YqxD family protein [bacterium]